MLTLPNGAFAFRARRLFADGNFSLLTCLLSGFLFHEDSTNLLGYYRSTKHIYP